VRDENNESDTDEVVVTVESPDYCLTDAICDNNQYCWKESGNCNGAGNCEFHADVLCVMQYDPVCGCDGQTYGSACTTLQHHMNIAHEVTYAAVDSQRQSIAWVKSRTPDGAETVYRSTDFDQESAEVTGAHVRRMDCIDCHNRPTHIYRPPARSVNHVMALGWISPQLPSAKSIAVQALEASYASEEEALAGIRTTIEQEYETRYPEIAQARKGDIDRAISEVQKIYSRNYFPEMQVDWKRFIDNIGHLYYPGCFRCHDGKHVSDAGKVLSRDCNVCHTILSQEFEDGVERVSLGGVDYVHPVDIGDAWKEMNCSDCHAGS